MLNIIEAVAHIFFWAIIGVAVGTLMTLCLKYTELISEDKTKIWVLILVVVGFLMGSAYGWYIYRFGIP